MTSRKKTKKNTLIFKPSITLIIAIFSLFAAPLISQQQTVLAQMVPSLATNNASSSSTEMTSATPTPGSVFKLARASVSIDIPLKKGYVNGNPVFYINTDMSDQKLAGQLSNATGFRINYVPLLARAPND